MDNRTHFVVGSGQFINNETPFLTWLNFDILTHLQDLGAAEILPINQANQAGILLDFGYKLNTLVNAKVTSLQISLVANNSTTGERWEFDRVNVSLGPNLIQTNGVQIVDSESSRDYKINSASPFNLVTLESTALVGTEQFYEGVVAQKITWQDYIANNNVATLFFNNAFPNNNRNQKASNYSNENGFSIHLLATAIVEGNDSVVGQSTQTIERLSSPINVYDYFESDDGVVTTGDIQAFDETETVNLGDEFILGQTVLFRTEWSGPNPLLLANLGYILHSLEPKNANGNLQIEESSTERGFVVGGALGEVTVTQSGANLISRCFIDTTRINLQDYTFSAYIETPGLELVGSYVLLDFKSLNGRNIVFTARTNIFAGKAFSSVNNEVITGDLLFRIGDTTTALNDANNGGWAAFPTINWAAFNAAVIPIGTKVRCEYTGVSTVVDLPCRIKCATDEAPTATVTNTIFTNSKIAANSVLLPTETQMSVDVVTSQFATTKFSANRTDLEIANSSDLTDFISGIGAASPLDLDKTGHLFLQNTTLNNIGTLSIQTTSSDANDGNIVGIASPLQNIYFPTTGNGLNLNAIKGDAINDLLYVPSGSTGGDLLYPSAMILGEERSYTWLGMQNSVGTYFEGGGEYLRYLGNSNAVVIRLGVALIQYAFEGAEGFSFGADSPVKYVTFTIKRLALTGIASAMYDINLYVNGRKMTNGAKIGTIITNTYTFGTTRFNLGMLNSTTPLTFANSFRNQNLNYFAMHKRILTTEEIRKIHLGNSISSFLPNYYYDFTNLVVSGGNRTIPNLGSDSIDSARLDNNTNTLFPLIP